ncbi:MAG TPA: DUF445 domain-containing protein, partial [bacterium]|nr:DUF445 domain-containing protein [bacterium]
TVGGAADWLDVKMIFDEIKIGRFRIVPASGIIPRKQKSIADGAGKLVAEEWLSKDSITGWLSSFDAASALAVQLKKIEQNGELDRFINWARARIIQWLDSPESNSYFEMLLREGLKSIKPIHFLGHSVPDEQFTKILHRLLDHAPEKIADTMTSQTVYELLRDNIEREQGFFSKLFFDAGELTERIITKATSILRSIAADENHELRLEIIKRSMAWKQTLKNQDNNTWDTWIQEIISETDLKQYIPAIKVKLKSLLDSETDSGKKIDEPLKNIWHNTIFMLESDRSLQIAVNTRFIEIASDMLQAHHGKIAELVSYNINKLSVQEIRDQFRSRTYDDMQWIRVNGAVAGFAIGILIGLFRLIIG